MPLPIILIHGFPLDAQMWAAQRTTLEKTGRNVLAVDLPGFGKSAEPPLDSIEAMGDFVAGIISTVGGKAVICGLSMGGYVAFAVLRKFPEFVSAAIFMDTRADADSAEAKQNRANAIAEIQANGPAKVYDGLLKRLVAPSASEEVKLTLLQMMQRQKPQSVMAAQRAMMTRSDQTELLGEIKVPVLYVVGDHDVITPPAVAQGMQGRTPAAKLAQIAGTGHMSNMENAGAVNGAMVEFLASVA